MVSREPPPNGLQLVIDFVNTRSIELGTDAIANPAQLATWLAERGLIEPSADQLDADDVRRALELREQLRAVLLANTRGEDAHVTALERAARRGRLSIAFSAGGAATIAPRSGGIDGALAAVLAPVARATLDGTWRRMKACDAPDCVEAFYDRSRNHAGRWCEMAVCGNRTKVRAYRAKSPSHNPKRAAGERRS